MSSTGRTYVRYFAMQCTCYRPITDELCTSAVKKYETSRLCMIVLHRSGNTGHVYVSNSSDACEVTLCAYMLLTFTMILQ